MDKVISYLESRIKEIKDCLEISYEPERYYADLEAKLCEVEEILYDIRRM